MLAQGALAVLLAACTPEDPPPSMDRPDPLLASELRAATRALTDLGPRINGDPVEEEARAAVHAMFREAGLSEVRSEPFEWDVWRPGPATLTVGGQAYVAHALSPTPPSMNFTRPLWTQLDDFREAFVLMSSDDGSRAIQFMIAALGGAAGMIRVTEDLGHDGGQLVEVGHTLDGTTLTSVAVDRATGDVLRGAVGQEVRLDIDTTVLEDHTSFNVLGRIPGRTAQTPIWVVAHYDSWHPSESAFDNALGVGAQVQLAKALMEGPQPTRDVVFLATSGEEQGLQGALAWVEDNPDEAEDAGVVLVLDVIWAGEGRFSCSATREPLRELSLAAYADLGVDVRDGGDPGVGSDHVPFVTRGADAIWCQRWPDRHYHTTRDTLEELDFDEIEPVIRGQLAILQELAGVE